MKYIKNIALLAFSYLLAFSALADTYNLDAAHSRIGFKIRHLGISFVNGNFNSYEGSGDYDSKTGKIASLNVNIEAKSIDTDVKDRDAHLRSADFFEVSKFKDIKFTATKFDYNGKIPTKIHGEIEIKGVKKPLTLEVSNWGTATDPRGNHRLAFEATGKLDRTKFGLTWNKGLPQAAGLLVGNEVTLLIAVEAVQAKASRLSKTD